MVNINPATQLPRLANRVMLECAMAQCDAAAKLSGRKFDVGIQLIFLAQQTLSVERQRTGRPAGVSINSLASSLGRPFETVRRHVHQLEKLGLCRKIEGGVMFTPSKNSGAGHFLDLVHDYTLRLIEDLQALSYPLPQSSGGASNETITLGGLDLLTSLLDLGALLHEDWTRMQLYYAVMIANARPITTDRVLAYRYADASTPPPAAVRMPVSAKSLSRALSIPYATIRRQLALMEAAGQIVRVPRGWLLHENWAQGEQVLESGIQSAAKLDSMLRHFARAGFPLDRPQDHYRLGRPPLVEFS